MIFYESRGRRIVCGTLRSRRESRAGGSMTFEIFRPSGSGCDRHRRDLCADGAGDRADLQCHARDLCVLWRSCCLFGVDAGSFELQRMPGTVWLVLTLAALAFLVEARLAATAQSASVDPEGIPHLGRSFLLSRSALTFLVGAQDLSLPVSILLTIALVLPLGPLLYRIVFQPIATAPVLVLLMVAVALHFAIAGLALLYFGPEGFRTQAFVRGDVMIGSFGIPQQLIADRQCRGHLLGDPVPVLSIYANR